MGFREIKIITTGTTLSGASEFQAASQCEAPFGLEGGAESYQIMLMVSKRRFENALTSNKYTPKQNRVLRRELKKINLRLREIEKRNYLYNVVTEDVRHFTS